MQIDRTTAPISDRIPDFRFPEYEKILLNNKVILYLSHNPSQPLASIKIILKDGAFDEEKAGTAFMTSQMLIKGTSKMNSARIADTIESYGATLNSSAQWDDTSMSSLFLAEFIEPVFEIVFDCLLNSQFDNDEFEKLRMRHISAIMQENADISYLAQHAFYRAIFDGTGYGNPLIGTIESVKDLNRDDLYDKYQDLLSSSSMSIIVAGNFERDRVIHLLNSKLENFDSVQSTDNTIKMISFDKNIIALIDKSESNQISLKIGNLTISRNDPDFPYMQILNTIFGGYFLSRLNTILREERGLTYGIYSMIESRKKASIQTTTSGLNKECIRESINIILSEYDKIAHGNFDHDDVKSATRYILGSFLRSIETPQQIAGMIQSIDQFDLPNNFFDVFYKKIAATDLDMIKSIAPKLFNHSKFVISAAGEIEIIKEQLKDLGDLIIFEV